MEKIIGSLQLEIPVTPRPDGKQAELKSLQYL